MFVELQYMLVNHEATEAIIDRACSNAYQLFLSG